MALKPDRDFIQWRLDYYMDSTASKGGFASMSTGGSGVAMDDAANKAVYATNPSGAKVLGVLLDDVVDTDVKLRRNPYKEEVQVGGKVSIASRGWCVTNMVYPGVTPTAGATAFLGQSGYVTTVQAAGAPQVGRFETSKDEDGYVKVSIL
jgi:hypothetical protein